nr:EOG090X0A1W [Artemia franciscana]
MFCSTGQKCITLCLLRINAPQFFGRKSFLPALIRPVYDSKKLMFLNFSALPEINLGCRGLSGLIDDQGFQKMFNLINMKITSNLRDEEMLLSFTKKLFFYLHSLDQPVYESKKYQHTSRRNVPNFRGEIFSYLYLLDQFTNDTRPLSISLNPDQEVPGDCGGVPSNFFYIQKSAGDMVAALVKGPEADENWILAEVVSFSQSQGRYEVFDIDEEQKEKHILSKRRIVVLPLMRASPEINPEAIFSKGTSVMALYPQTTCFYKAIISELPSSSQDDYHVSFEDPNYAGGFSPPLMVPQRYVFALKEKKK